MSAVRRGLVLGLGFGLAAASIELWLSLVPFMQRRFGGGPVLLLKTGLLLVALGALLGLAGAPLLRWRGGRGRASLLHVAWLAGAWACIERWVALDSPLFAPAMWLRPFGAAALLLLALLLARWRPWPAWTPWTLGVLLATAAAFAPGVYLAATSEKPAPRPELPPAAAGAPDVVLVVLDTERAQNLSSYGHTRETSPGFDALAREGALFADATSPSTWSLPSHASLFTGRYPSSHGAHSIGSLLDQRFPTLAGVLAAHGYETVCFTSNAWISDGLGLTRGFAWQDESWRTTAGAGSGFSFAHRLLDRLGFGAPDKGGAGVAAHFAEWMRGRAPDARPAFVFLNFIEAHFPYHQLPGEYRSRYTDRPRGELRDLSLQLMAQQFGGPAPDLAKAAGPARDMYDGGVLYTDELLQRVVEAIRARGTLDRTVLVVLADHGEMLGEHGAFFGHGPSLYQRVVGVPFLLRYPPRVPAGVRVETPVSTVGAFATILDLLGVEAPPTLQVGSLLPLANGGRRGDDPGGPILAEVMQAEGPRVATSGDPQMSSTTNLRALRVGSWKLVESSDGRAFLYDLAVDPQETRDLAGERPDELAHLRARLEQTRARLELPPLDAIGKGAPAPELDPATRERLRELGYVE